MSEPQRSLLLVTDDERFSSEFRFALSGDIDLRSVKDAREAWLAMGERVPDIVCVEIRSGSAGGFALARDMAHKAALHRVPVVMLLEREQDRWLAEQAGAKAAFVQPVSPADVMRHINEVLVDSLSSRSA